MQCERLDGVCYHVQVSGTICEIVNVLQHLL